MTDGYDVIVYLILILYVFDVVIVVNAFAKWGPRARELNPATGWMVDHLGMVPGIVVLKALVLAAILLLYTIFYTWVQGVLFFVHLTIVLHNLNGVRNLKARYG